jgi:hypothetical protein
VLQSKIMRGFIGFITVKKRPVTFQKASPKF